MSTWIVGYDFSDCADAAAHFAARQLAPSEGTLILLHAYQIPVQPGGQELLVSSGAIKTWEDVQHAVIETVRRRLEEKAAVLEAAHPGVTVQGEPVRGFAEATILAAVGRHDAERVVVGTHGRTGIKHLFLGSVAGRVARLSAVPVIVVKAPDRDAGQLSEPVSAA